MENNTALSKMAFRESENTLYLIAGYGSEGLNYKLKLGDHKWELLDQSHAALVGEKGLELTFREAIHFP